MTKNIFSLLWSFLVSCLNFVTYSFKDPVEEGMEYSLRNFLAPGGYTYIDPRITEERFPSPQKPFVLGEVSIARFDCITQRQVSVIEAFVQIDSKYRRATLYELLIFAVEHEQDLIYPLVALGSLVKIDGVVYAPCLNKTKDGSELQLRDVDNHLSTMCSFLAVRRE